MKITRVDHRKTNGTNLQGYLDTSYQDLVAVFGPPEDGIDKTQAEWLLQFEGEVIATIYDYKMYGVAVETIRNWHIGGRSQLAVELVGKAMARRGTTRSANLWPNGLRYG
jgi:hypothetical protein